MELKTKIVIKRFINKYISVIPSDLMQELTGFVLKGFTKVWITSSTIIELDKRLFNRKAQEKAMKICAKRNAKGLEYEKVGKISMAIKTYEANIVEGCYPALNAFERLMIIYRKQKQYEEEIRIIDRAIDVLCPRFPDLLEKYQARKIKAETLLSKIK